MSLLRREFKYILRKDGTATYMVLQEVGMSGIWNYQQDNSKLIYKWSAVRVRGAGKCRNSSITACEMQWENGQNWSFRERRSFSKNQLSSCLATVLNPFQRNGHSTNNRIQNFPYGSSPSLAESPPHHLVLTPNESSRHAKELLADIEYDSGIVWNILR